MNRAYFVACWLPWVSVACGGNTPPREPAPTAVVAAPAASEAAPELPPSALPSRVDAGIEPIEAVAERFFRAILAGDRETARDLALSHAEFSAYSKKAISEADYNQQLEAFLDARAREGKDADSSQSLVGARVKERRSLRASENRKLKRDAELAIVQPLIQRGEDVHAAFPLFFLLTERGWRYTRGP